MTWLTDLAPLIAVVLAIVAYFGGKSAGKKEAELKQKIKEQNQNDEAQNIIDNNNNLTADNIDSWLQERAKK